MRWFWIDRFVEFERGRKAVTLKHVSLADSSIDDYQLGWSNYPSTLIIEGMAQTGGLLISEKFGFEQRVVLAKIIRATFHREALPGDRLRLTATVEDIQERGAIVSGRVTLDSDRDEPPALLAELELSFAFLGERFGESQLFPPEDLLRTLRMLHLFRVGKDELGQPLQPPNHMLEAERPAN